MNNGYIKLYRKCLENEFFLEKPFDRWRAFEYLLISARYKPSRVILKGQVIELEAGQLIVSEKKLAEKWDWSRGKVRRFLSLLESLQMIQVNGTAYGTIVTIENYSRYQDGRATSEATYDTTDSTSDSTTNRATDSTSIKKDKKDKKVKKDKNIYNSARARVSHGDGVSIKKFIPPEVQEVRAYCMERGNDVDPERFVDFYEANGWMVGKNKMKDWRAAVRNWERNEASKSTAQTTQQGRLDWIDEI
ncbi:MAG: hypothetical protein V8Q42_11155 [Anaerovoracaceae bacterium]